MNKENQIQQIAEKAIKDILAVRDAREEKEYRAGEWVPKYDAQYWFADPDGDVTSVRYTGRRYDMNRMKTGNAFPTEAIAEAAKAYADWWREFDMTADTETHKGNVELSKTNRHFATITYHPGSVRLSVGDVERLGGEQKVIEMLNKGRVFRFKWGGE